MRVSKVLSTLMLMVFGVTSSVAQIIDFDDYKPLKSQGVLPSDFTERTSDKVAEAIESQVDKGEARATRASKAEFLLKANYMIDNLLMSGNVMFGDPTTDYVNRVADKILENEPELRNKLRFYCIKSNVTNAFTTNQGMIFVTLGLLAQLENEAQLAFILGHEVTHYKRKHVINTVLESDKIFSKSDRTTKMSQDKNIIKLSNYSKSLELESDSTGFYYVQKAGYDMDEVLSSFDILQFSHLPYDEIEIDFSEFERDSFLIPDEKQLDTLIAIDFEVEENDSKSTHPNLNKRRDEIFALMEEFAGINKGVTALVSEKDFLNVRKISRYETVRIDLKNLNFVKAYYNATVLLKENPNSSYLKKSVAKALYGISKFKLKNRYSHCADDYEEYEGAISAAYYFFENASDLAITSLAVKYIYETNKDNPNSHLESILNDLTLGLIKEVGVDFKFEKFFPSKIKTNEIEQDTLVEDVTETVDEDPDKPLSKYEKLKKIREAQEAQDEAPIVAERSEVNYYKFAFTDYEDRKQIKELFTSIHKTWLKETKDEEEDEEEEEEIKKNYNKNKISAKKVLFIDPMYYSVDERQGVKLENSEDLKYKFYDQITRIGALTELETEVLSPKQCEVGEYEKMNHLSVCNDWAEEINDLSDVHKHLNFIPSQSEYMKNVSEVYGTDNIAFTGVVDFNIKKRGMGILAAAVVPYAWPFLAGYLLSDKHEVYYYTFIYDAASGDVKVDKIYFMNRKPMEANINSYMYEMFSIMKAEN